jgi:phospholipase C
VDGLKGDIDSKTRELANIEYENPAVGHLFRPFITDHDLKLATDLPHGRDAVRQQMSPNPHGTGFLMDGFAAAHVKQFTTRDDRPSPLAIFPPNLIPATSFLARGYMVCDRWFAAIPTDTHPNRLMSLSGYTKLDTTGGKPPNHDPCIIDWCDQRHIRWRVYSNGFPFLAVVRPQRYLFGGHSNFRNFDDLALDFQTEDDAHFPQVIYVEPDFLDDPLVRTPNDNHPPLPMGPGEAFLADVYRAVTSNKKRWANTVMVLVYDEHGGFFDHVPPFPVTTKPPAGHQWQDKRPFSTSGPRVPAIIVSPFVTAASVTHERFDHTALLQFIADVFDGGNPYSGEVARRRQEGEISRIRDVLSTTPRKDVPFLPPLPPMSSLTFQSGREPTTPAMRAFAEARAELHATDPHVLGKKLPEVAFHMPFSPQQAAEKPTPKTAKAGKKSR